MSKHRELFEAGWVFAQVSRSNGDKLSVADAYDSYKAAAGCDSAYIKVMAELTAAANNEDTEGAHIDADSSLASFVQTLGFDDVAEAYDKVNKWYS